MIILIVILKLYAAICFNQNNPTSAHKLQKCEQSLRNTWSIKDSDSERNKKQILRTRENISS